MSKQFSEIVIEGGFMLAKGFLLGFLSQQEGDTKYFFHRKSGIRRETFRELLKEFFELDNHVHVCLQQDLVEKFEKATKLYADVTGNKIKSVKPIKGASFSFSYEFFNEDLAAEAKSILENLPAGVKLVDYVPYEEVDTEGAGVEAYAPLHEFTSGARGKLTGEFEEVMDVFLKIKKSDLAQSIMCSEVSLEF